MAKKKAARKKTAKRNRGNNSNTPEALAARKKRFLEAFEECGGLVELACKNAEFTTRTVFNWKDRDEEFLEAFQDVKSRCVQNVEETLYRQALAGNVQCIKIYLRANAREKYQDNYIPPESLIGDHADPGIDGFLKSLHRQSLASWQEDKEPPRITDAGEIIDAEFTVNDSNG